MTKFEAGKKYSFEWYCEDSKTSTLTVISRTTKMVVISYNGEQKRKKIYTDANGEYIMPTGSYSMAPICQAKNICETETENTQEENTMTKVIKFEAGKEYETAYGETYKIVKRSKCYAVIENSAGERVRKTVAVYDGSEDTEAINLANWPELKYLYAKDEIECSQEKNTMTVEQIIEAVKKSGSIKNALQILNNYELPMLEEIAQKAQLEPNRFDNAYAKIKEVSSNEHILLIWVKTWIREELGYASPGWTLYENLFDED